MAFSAVPGGTVELICRPAGASGCFSGRCGHVTTCCVTKDQRIFPASHNRRPQAMWQLARR